MISTAGLIPGDDLRPRLAGAGGAQGRGPNLGGEFSQEDDHGTAAGWGGGDCSVMKGAGRTREAVRGPHAILKIEPRERRVDCPAAPGRTIGKGLHLDICENGIKHVTWEMTRKKVGREFFAAHTVTELSGWNRTRAGGPGPAHRAGWSTTRRATSYRRSLGTARLRAGRGQPCAGWTARTGRRSNTSGRLSNEANLPVPAVGAGVRHEQPAGLLEHVPRGVRRRGR